MADKIQQIVITRVEQPGDTPQGEVFKVSIFDSKECVDSFHHGSEKDTLEEVGFYLEDLVSA